MNKSNLWKSYSETLLRLKRRDRKEGWMDDWVEGEIWREGGREGEQERALQYLFKY